MCKTPKYQYSMLPVQSDSREIVSILQGDNIGNCEGKKLIRKRFSFWMVTKKQLSKHGAHCSFVELNEQRNLQKQGSYTRWIAR